VTEPQQETASPGARRAGTAASALGAAALLAAAVLYWSAGPPHGVNVGAGGLYLLGLFAGLCGGVLLWMGRAPGRPGLGWTTAALLLVSVCGVVSLSHVTGGGVQVVLMAVTAVVLAGAALVARRA
jgi:hypothetical protein